VKAGSADRESHTSGTASVTRSLRRPPSSPTSNDSKAPGTMLTQRGASVSSPARSTATAVKSETHALSPPGPATFDSRPDSHDSGKPVGESPDPSTVPVIDHGMTPAGYTTNHKSSSPMPSPQPVSQPHLYPVPSASPLDSVLWQAGKGS
jgi:hypothetical protein